MSYLAKLRKFAKLRTVIGLFLIGAFFLTIGILALRAPQAERLTAEAVITRIEEYREGEELCHRLYIRFTDVAGVLHENVEYNAYSSGMREGGTVTVEYDAENPEAVSSPNSGFLPYLITAVGAAALAAALLMVAPALRMRTDRLEEFDRVDDPPEAEPDPAEAIRSSTEPTCEYYFHYCGKLNQSYILETPQRRPVYEAAFEKFGALSNVFTFRNCLTGTSKTCKVSHTLTESDGIGRNMRIVTASSFKIDGVSNWDALGKLGYSLAPGIRGIRVNFDLYYHGVPVGQLEAAGANILSDDRQYKLGDVLPGKGLYRVTCRPSDIEGAFLACFSAARTELF